MPNGTWTFNIESKIRVGYLRPFSKAQQIRFP